MTPPEGFIDFDEYVAQCRVRWPDFDERLAAARVRLAPLLYPEGGREYARMMRGEPPQKVH